MSTYTQILYQIVFSTKHREPTLIKKDREKLYMFIHGLLKNKRCHLYRIGGVEDHIHIVLEIHPSIALAMLVKDIKLASHDFIKKNDLFPMFHFWQEGYGAFTYTIGAKDSLIEYVKNQEEHHRTASYDDEYRLLLKEHHLEYDERYMD